MAGPWAEKCSPAQPPAQNTPTAAAAPRTLRETPVAGRASTMSESTKRRASMAPVETVLETQPTRKNWLEPKCCNHPSMPVCPASMWPRQDAPRANGTKGKQKKTRRRLLSFFWTLPHSKRSPTPTPMIESLDHRPRRPQLLQVPGRLGPNLFCFSTATTGRQCSITNDDTA